MDGGYVYYFYEERISGNVYLCLAFFRVYVCEMTILSLVYRVSAYCSLDVQVLLRGSKSCLARIAIATVRGGLCRLSVPLGSDVSTD